MAVSIEDAALLSLSVEMLTYGAYLHPVSFLKFCSSRRRSDDMSLTLRRSSHPGGIRDQHTPRKAEDGGNTHGFCSYSRCCSHATARHSGNCLFSVAALA